MRKYFLTTAAVLLLAAALLTVPACADAAVTTGSDVNIRSGPGMGYDVIDCLPYGYEIDVFDSTLGDWYAITYDDCSASGFIYSAYVKFTGTETPAPQPTAPAVDPASGEGTINAMYVNFRSGPSRDYAVLGTYNSGTPLTITGISGDWTAVTIYGVSGYVYSQYVSKGSSSAPVPAATPEPTPTPTPPPAVQETPSVTPMAERSGTVNGDYVRFRTGPSTSHSIIDSYNRGKAVTVTGSSGDWYAAVIDGQSGYIYSQYVSFNDVPAQEQPQQAAPQVTPTAQSEGYIKGNSVRFRSGPSTGYDILGEYNYGTKLTITGTSGDWTAVTINGVSGFVCSQYVATGSASASAVAGVSGSDDLRTQIVNFALQYEGWNYCWGGTSPDTGFDCSGFVYYVYQHFGYTLNRVACDQAANGDPVNDGELLPGDVLCFYSGSDYIGHAGLYIGNNQFIHASSSTTGVIISDLDGYYNTRGFIARRIIS